MDRVAGFSAKGDFVSSPPNSKEIENVVNGPTITVRLGPPGTCQVEILPTEEIQKYGLPEKPGWYIEFFESLEVNPVWRDDPNLTGRFHPEYPDDLQVIVHDGGPRISEVPPEVIWATIVGTGQGYYTAIAHNQPFRIKSISQGEEFKFVIPKNAKYPFLVTDKYLEEKTKWKIIACEKCGNDELFDAPSTLISRIFPDLPKDPNLQMQNFTSFCPMCGGVQIIVNRDAENENTT
jgi:hypothetical protein